jgi:hypothetical protein
MKKNKNTKKKVKLIIFLLYKKKGCIESYFTHLHIDYLMKSLYFFGFSWQTFYFRSRTTLFISIGVSYIEVHHFHHAPDGQYFICLQFRMKFDAIQLVIFVCMSIFSFMLNKFYR